MLHNILLDHREWGLDKLIATYLRSKRKDKEWASLIFRRFQRFTDMGANDKVLRCFVMYDTGAQVKGKVQRHYISLALNLSTFGITYFDVEVGLLAVSCGPTDNCVGCGRTRAAVGSASSWIGCL